MILRKIICKTIFTFAFLLNLEARAADHLEARAVDHIEENNNLTKKIALEMHYEGRPTFIDHAKRLCDNTHQQLEDLLTKLTECGFKNLKRKAELLADYYPHLVIENIVIPHQIREATFFIEADRLAFRILSNSMEYFQSNNADPIKLLYECLRFFCTGGGDFSGYRDSTSYPIYFFNRLDKLKSILACVLCTLDLQSEMPLKESPHELVKISANLGVQGWYFNIFLASCSSFEDEEIQSLLDLNESIIRQFKGSKSAQIPPTLAEPLKQTELFKILDHHKRSQYIFKFPHLLEYNIYLGSIEDYYSKPIARPSLLASAAASSGPFEDTKSAPLKKQERKEYKGKSKKGKEQSHPYSRPQSKRTARLDKSKSPVSAAQIGSTESPAPAESSTEPQYGSTPPAEAAARISSTVHSVDRGDSTTLTDPTDNLERAAAEESSGWIQVTTQKKGGKETSLAPTTHSKLRRLSLEELRELAQNNQLRYMDYILVRNISRYSPSYEGLCTNYDYNGTLVHTREQFSILRQTVTKHQAHSFFEHFAVKKGYSHLSLPNIVKFFITFHLSRGGKTFEHTFQDDDVYMSGAQLFERSNDSFKKSHHIRVAYNDVLTSEEQKQYWTTTDVRQLFLHKTVLDKIYNQIVHGRWLFNALHSEPQLLLDLYNTKLPSYMLYLNEKFPHSTIHGMALGISSLYECCFRCRNLIQGFQWRLESTLRSHITHCNLQDTLTLSPSFNSIVLFDEQLPIKHSDDPRGENGVSIQATTPYLRSTETASTKKHKFILISTLPK